MVHHTQVPNVAVHNVPQEMPSNVERVRRSTMTIGGLMYVPRHMVFNAAHGKTACHLGLNMGTIAALLSNFEPFWCSTTRKNGKLRSSRELRRQLRKHLLHAYFWSSMPWMPKKITRKGPDGELETLRELHPEPMRTYKPDWDRLMLPEYARAEAEGIHIDMYPAAYKLHPVIGIQPFAYDHFARI